MINSNLWSLCVMSYGWLTESSCVPKPGKKITNVSSQSFGSLKSLVIEAKHRYKKESKERPLSLKRAKKRINQCLEGSAESRKVKGSTKETHPFEEGSYGLCGYDVIEKRLEEKEKIYNALVSGELQSEEFVKSQSQSRLDGTFTKRDATSLCLDVEKKRQEASGIHSSVQPACSVKRGDTKVVPTGSTSSTLRDQLRTRLKYLSDRTAKATGHDKPLKEASFDNDQQKTSVVIFLEDNTRCVPLMHLNNSLRDFETDTVKRTLEYFPSAVMKKKQRLLSDNATEEDKIHLDYGDLTTTVDETDGDTSLSEDELIHTEEEPHKDAALSEPAGLRHSHQQRSVPTRNAWKSSVPCKKNNTRPKKQVVFSANQREKDPVESPDTLAHSRYTNPPNTADTVYSQPDILESDDEEGDVTRIGDVPLSWYDNLKHVGYDTSGNRVEKTLDTSEISSLLRNADNPEAWRDVLDVRNQRVIQLTDKDLQIIQNIRSGRYPLGSYDPYGPDSIVEFDNPEAAVHPVACGHPPKRRFLPSLWENQKINHLVKLIREGRIRVKGPQIQEVYDVWGKSIFVDTADATRGFAKGPPPLPAPKLRLPGHDESYNTPEEYLLSKEEEEDWLQAHPEDRELNFLPRKYSCLRRVPAYKDILLERFQRCLDLYLCPRSIKTRMNVDPDSLLPQLPSADSLRPFPTRLGFTFESPDTSRGTGLSFDSTGTYLVIARESGRLDFFETSTTRLVLQWPCCVKPGSMNSAMHEAPIRAVAFSPTSPLVLCAKGSELYVLLVTLDAMKSSKEGRSPSGVSCALPRNWDLGAAEEVLQLWRTDKMDSWKPFTADGVCGWQISHSCEITSISWHPRGLYFVSVCHHATSPSQQLQIHSLTKLKSIAPLRKSPGGHIRKACFHPSKPWLFVAFQSGVRLYDLETKKTTPSPEKHNVKGVIKKFKGVMDILDMSIHPSGDHFIVGGENQRVSWFDYDLGERPYKILRYHKNAVKTVAFHSTYPLLCSGSSDGNLHIIHGKVFQDLMNPPAIIPVKKLSAHKEFNLPDAEQATVVCCQWHPLQPWLATLLRNGQSGIFV